MANTTVELRNLLKLDTFELFDFDYNFDDEQMAEDIEQSIIEYFFFYEIGSMSVDRFKHQFRTRFQRIIGYYNQLHNTTLLKYDPLINYQMTEALERLSNTQSTNKQDTEAIEERSNITNVTQSTTGKDTSDSQTDTEDDSTTTRQGTTLDYPQNTISGDFRSDEQNDNSTTHSEIEQSTISTSETEGELSSQDIGSLDATSTQNVEGSNISDQLETYEKTIEGMTGRTYQELIQLERDTIVRIKAMIIDEMKSCFLLVF